MAYRLKSPDEMHSITLAGEAVWRVLGLLENAVRPGITTRELEQIALVCCENEGLTPSMPQVRHPETGINFPGICSVCVNDEAAHAPPSNRELRQNDLVTIDLAGSKGGWYADAARTVLVASSDLAPRADLLRLIDAADQVTLAAIGAMAPGRFWSDAAQAARVAADRLGVFILPGLGGHGVGRALHEAPAARFDSVRGEPGDFVCMPGTVLAVEPVVTLGPETVAGVCDDGWTLRTTTGQVTACEERTVGVTPTGVRTLTGPTEMSAGDGAGSCE